MEDMRIEFGPEGRMIIQSHQSGEVVQKAGYVKLVNSTLTSMKDCEGREQWLGVQVQGMASRSQSPFLQYPDWQGTLVMENSEISNASYALDFWDGNLSKTGGRIRAIDSRFLNNRKSVAFYPYRNFNPNNSAIEWPYEARFSNCDFTVDRALPNDFMGFITASEVRGFRIAGCRFKNISGVQTFYNFGILGSCGVVVDGIYTSPSSPVTGSPNIPTEFHNLKEAVHIGTSGNINAYATVLNSKFYNCNVGVQSDGLLGGVTVRNNIFDLKEGVCFTPDKKKGVFIQTGTGFLVNNNTFDNSLNPRSSPGTTGVTVWNSGSTDNVVYNNIYRNIYTGDLSNFINRSYLHAQATRGLKFLCGDHFNNPWDISARGNNEVTNGMHPLQLSGGTVDAGIAAGNVFSFGRGYWELANWPGEVASVRYYYYAGNQGEIPQNYAPSVTVAQGGDAKCSDAGPVYSDGPIRPIPAPVWPPRTLNSPGTTEATLERAEAIAYFTSDTTGMQHRDSLYMWLQLPGRDAYHDLMRTDMLLQDTLPNDATLLYDNIVATHGLAGQEAEEFTIWGKKLLNLRKALLQSSRNTWQINPAEKDTLTDVATNGTMWAKVRAQGWLNMIDPDLQFANEVLYPYCDGINCSDDDSTGGGQNKMAPRAAELPTIAQAAEKAVSIAPNPTTGLVRVSVNSTSPIMVTDLSGQTVFSTSLKEGVQEVNLSSLAGGTYLYTIRSSTGTTFTGKLVKQ